MSNPYLPSEILMGFTHPKASFRQSQVPFRRSPRIMDEDLPGPFQLRSCVFYPHLGFSRHDDGPPGGRFGSNLFSRCTIEVGNPRESRRVGLAPFHKFSHSLKSLRVYSLFLSCTQILNFVCSFPLLEDLTLSGLGLLLGNDDDRREPQTIIPSFSPTFIRSLDLPILEGTESITRRLLDLPDGLPFRKFRWETRDLGGITELVARCSDTLECLDIACGRPRTSVLVLRWSFNLHPPVGDSSPASIDLSK